MINSMITHMTRWLRLFLPLLFLVSGLFGIRTATLVHAEEGNYQLTIVKYKLSEEDIDSGLLPTEPVGSLATGVADEDGQALEPFPGIHYRIVKVTPSNNASDPFTEVAGFEPIEIITDATGLATLTLPEGLYEVTELAHDGLSSPAEPVIVQFPSITAENEELDHLYLYPKSSMTVDPSAGTLDPTDPNGESPNGGKSASGSPARRIPQTSGNIGTLWPVYLTIGLILILGTIGVLNFRPKRNKKR